MIIYTNITQLTTAPISDVAPMLHCRKSSDDAGAFTADGITTKSSAII